jgi:5-methylcytosine-specific restriction endonuclease McrA
MPHRPTNHHQPREDSRRPAHAPDDTRRADEAPVLDVDGDVDLASLAATGGMFSVGMNGSGGGAVSEGMSAKVLVLNKLYVAVRVVSVRRAFCLLARDIAEVIHVENGSDGPRYLNYDFESWTDVAALRTKFQRQQHDWIKTVRFEIAVPRIIRLIGYDRLPEQTVKLNRRNLFARDRNTCQYCGRHFPTADLSLDHVKPRTQGGGDTWENLVCACIKCNAKKGGRTPDEARMKLIKKPERPKRNPLIALRLGHEKYASWKTFLDNAYWSVELR